MIKFGEIQLMWREMISSLQNSVIISDPPFKLPHKLSKQQSIFSHRSHLKLHADFTQVFMCLHKTYEWQRQVIIKRSTSHITSADCFIDYMIALSHMCHELSRVQHAANAETHEIRSHWDHKRLWNPRNNKTGAVFLSLLAISTIGSALRSIQQ